MREIIISGVMREIIISGVMRVAYLHAGNYYFRGDARGFHHVVLLH
jgi:hypothetical protein